MVIWDVWGEVSLLRETDRNEQCSQKLLCSPLQLNSRGKLCKKTDRYVHIYLCKWASADKGLSCISDQDIRAWRQLSREIGFMLKEKLAHHGEREETQCRGYSFAQPSLCMLLSKDTTFIPGAASKSGLQSLYH